MRLFQVSEESDIHIFKPREPTRADLNKSIKMVWAINEKRLVNFLTPRDCPRVTFFASDTSTKEDVEKYIGRSEVDAVLAIEQVWFERMLNTTLYIYEFDPTNFILQDEIAGYYISTKVEVPVGITRIDNLFSVLFERNVEVRILPSLWHLHDNIKSSSLGFSMCRMRNALPR